MVKASNVLSNMRSKVSNMGFNVSPYNMAIMVFLLGSIMNIAVAAMIVKEDKLTCSKECYEMAMASSVFIGLVGLFVLINLFTKGVSMMVIVPAAVVVFQMAYSVQILMTKEERTPLNDLHKGYSISIMAVVSLCVLVTLYMIKKQFKSSLKD